MYKPKKVPLRVKLDEELVIDRKWYLVDISPKGVVKVYNHFTEDENGGYKRVFVNDKGYFYGTPQQIAELKKKLIKL